MAAVHLRSLFSADAISLKLEACEKSDILRELVTLLKLDAESQAGLYRALRRRENMGSSGIGRGVAIPHCRSRMVNRIHVAFARKSEGVDFNALDRKPVYYFFLIIAPAEEDWYLTVLADIAQFARDPDVHDRLAQLETPEQFLALLNENADVHDPERPGWRGTYKP
ncbi:MAG: PTS sugar transporter subunit IIA [Gemmatimonadota bacterium]|nr:MAG: PTS sugar transporter subunit IIA [Gemmatimonadota bacterium]